MCPVCGGSVVTVVVRQVDPSKTQPRPFRETKIERQAPEDESQSLLLEEEEVGQATAAGLFGAPDPTGREHF